MASAQVLPNAAGSSRKQGHLEAGKRRLEEFRKKKAEERAKKVASTGQLQSSGFSQPEKFPKESSTSTLYDSDGAISERDGISSTQLSGPVTIPDSKKINASQIVELNSSNVTSAGISALSKSTVYVDRVEKSSSYQEPKWPDGSSFPGSDYGYYSQWREETKNKLSSFTGTESEPINRDEPVSLDTVHTYPHVDENIHQPSDSLYEARPVNSLQEYPVKDPGRTNFSLASNFLDSTSSKTNLTQSAPRVDVHVDGDMNINNSRVSMVAGEVLSSYHYPKVDSAGWQTSEYFSSGSSLNAKSSSDRGPLHSTISEVGIRRSRPSFLDSLNVSRVSSLSNLPFTELDKSEHVIPLRSSKVQNEGIFASSTSQPSFAEPDTAEPLVKLRTPTILSADMHSVSPSVSIINDEIPRLNVQDDSMQRKHEFPSFKKDDDFAALEQHIEDLTQEKFSLQRALEASRVLAESLAVENSSLTDSFNQQGAVVNQLKSDMERLQEEIRNQLSALESVKMEYAHAQLECSAADERAKLLAAEVIGLEEKALRLKSNGLKLERELENSNAEINSYKRKVSSLQKERQDFQSTISALQEEKKLLQSKLRKASGNGKAVTTKALAATTTNVSTSTDDLVLDPVDSNSRIEVGTISNRATNDTVASESAALPSDMTTIPLPQESREFHIPDASGSIPPDQLRMVGNINSLISELAAEKEELVRALSLETSSSSKLKDLNKDLSQKLEAQTQRLELLTAQRMANENLPTRPAESNIMLDGTQYADEGDEVVERVLGWIMKLFPGGPTKRRTSKLL
ncbi:hypothetical protein AAC387_Pa09g0591 [Persea americana]